MDVSYGADGVDVHTVDRADLWVFGGEGLEVPSWWFIWSLESFFWQEM